MTSRMFGIVLIGAAILATLMSAAGRDAPPAPASVVAPSPPTVLDRRAADYYEDEGGGRILADVESRILAGPGRHVRFEADISATGPRVVPVPGFSGIIGANRITAEELKAIITERRWGVRVVDQSGRASAGTLVVTKSGPIPERRIRADGTIDEHGVSGEVFPLTARLSTPPLPEGRHLIELEVDGEPRLRALVRVFRHSARILELESLAARDHRRTDS